MPQNASTRFAYAVVVLLLLGVIGRNLYRRNLNNRLVAAVEQKNVAAVRHLLARGADPNSRRQMPGTRTGDTLLAFAMGDYRPSSASQEIANLLLQHGAGTSIDKQTLTGYLGTACRDGNLALARCLLEHGADAHPSGQEEYNIPLNAAIGYGTVPQSFPLGGVASPDTKPTETQRLQIETEKKRRLQVSQEMIRLLEQYGAKMNARQIVSLDDVEALRACLDAGTAVEDRDPPSKVKDYNGKMTEVLHPTLLTLAAEEGSFACVHLLLERGANVNALSSSPISPLMGAIYGKHLAVVRLLLQKGANVNLKSRDSSSVTPTPLTAACYDLPELVPELLQHGANVQEQGGPALEIALQHHPELVPLLLQHGASAKGKTGYRVLTAAIQYHPDLVPMFLKQGANAHEAPTGDAQLISLAARHGRKELIELLARAGANLQSHTVYSSFGGPGGFSGTRTTPLIEALGQKSDILELLLKLGANPDISNSLNQYPLSLAAQGGNVEAARLLLKYGANVDGPADKQPNSYYHFHTPLYYARRHKHPKVAALLEQAGGHDR